MGPAVLRSFWVDQRYKMSLPGQLRSPNASGNRRIPAPPHRQNGSKHLTIGLISVTEATHSVSFETMKDVTRKLLPPARCFCLLGLLGCVLPPPTKLPAAPPRKPIRTVLKP